jgi:glycine/D-amino acid oxidase-like deaminating enzyme
MSYRRRGLYRGLSAGLTLARGGRSVQIFDRERPGAAASTRNGGIASGNLRASHSQLVRKFGETRATALAAEVKAAGEDLALFIKQEGIACDFKLGGRFTGAATAGAYERLAREADWLRKTWRIEAHAVPKRDEWSVLGTDFYHGGLLRHDLGGLDPAKLYAGLFRLARDAGATVHAETVVLGFAAEPAVSGSRRRAAASLPATSSSPPTATPMPSTPGCGVGSCRYAAASLPRHRSRTT